jgi:hypothetical protein
VASARRKGKASPPRTPIREGRKKLYREENNNKGNNKIKKVAKEPRQRWHTGSTSRLLPVESSTAFAAAVSKVGMPRADPIATLAQFLRVLSGSNY